MFRGQPGQGAPFQGQPGFGGYGSPNRFPSQQPQSQSQSQFPPQPQQQPQQAFQPNQFSPQQFPPQQQQFQPQQQPYQPQPQQYQPQQMQPQQQFPPKQQQPQSQSQQIQPQQFQPQQIQPQQIQPQMFPPQQFQPQFQPPMSMVQPARQPPQSPPPQQQPIANQPYYEVHHVERPLEVITIDEIENPWRLKCATLERQILELQIQLRKGQPSETIEVVDDSKVKQLEKQLEELRHISNDRDNEIDMLQGRINELMAQIEESNSSSQTVTYLTTEVETWKRKFKELEVELKNSERELAQADAELNRLKRQDQANTASQQMRSSGTRKTLVSK